MWIREPVMYFDLSDTSTDRIGSTGKVRGVSSGPRPVDVSAARVADTFGITVEELLDLNAAGDLKFSSWAVPARSAKGRALRIRVEHGAFLWFEITSERESLS